MAIVYKGTGLKEKEVDWVEGLGRVVGMRRRRWKVAADRPMGYYHCLSRVVEGRFALGEVEKERFVSLLREYERFCEVEVLTYCVMSNHFHVLLAVPQRPAVPPSGEQIVAKLKGLSGQHFVGAAEQELKRYQAAADPAGEAAFRERYYARMWDVSAFMKAVKQRFTQWYNGREERRGTLWEERFKSVVVEGTGQTLGAMAAYIDLNPVRAGLVSDPKDYRWSGYGAAMAGERRAKEGLRQVVGGLAPGMEESLSPALQVYRMHLYNEGSQERESVDQQGRTVRGALARQEVLQVLQAKGQLPLRAYLRCRVRYFCDGAVLGSRQFVETLFNECRNRFGPRRKTGARTMKGLQGENLFTVRNLRLRVFG
jgi:REP element-mobilizing transposase RayT